MSLSATLGSPRSRPPSPMLRWTLPREGMLTSWSDQESSIVPQTCWRIVWDQRLIQILFTGSYFTIALTISIEIFVYWKIHIDCLENTILQRADFVSEPQFVGLFFLSYFLFHGFWQVDYMWEDLRKEFVEMDPYGTGFISREEFKDVLTELCVHLSEFEINKLSDKFDLKRDGR